MPSINGGSQFDDDYAPASWGDEPKAPVTPPAPEVDPDELAGFIKVAQEQGHDCERRSNGEFANIYLNGAWLGWQQRAQYDNPALEVWVGAMPESNGKTNHTAILKRKGSQLWDEDVAITIDRSEYPGRVQYEADRMRYLIGEIDKEPCIMDYDPDEHSGYVKPPAQPTQAEVLLKSLWDDTGLRCLMRPDQARRVAQLLGVGCEYDN